MVITPFRTIGIRSVQRLHRGWGAMVSVTLIVVGFLLVTAVVMAVARESTARWERDRRAAVAARAEDAARRTVPTGPALRMPGAVTRTVAALRSRVARFRPGKALGLRRPEGGEQGPARGGPIRRRVGALRSSLSGGRLRRGRSTTSRPPAARVDGGPAGTAPAPEPSRAATGARSDGVDTGKLSRRAVPRARRRALAFLHRDTEPRDERVPREDRNESPTAH